MEERQAAWNEAKQMAADAIKSRKDRIDSGMKMVVSPSTDLPPEVLAAARQRVVGFSDASVEGGHQASDAARAVSLRQESKRSRVFKELHQQRADQSHFISFRLMNNGALRQVLEHMFRIACSHGSDLEDGRMSHKNFRIYFEQLGVTTISPYDQFEPRSTLIIRDKNNGGNETADEVQLLRFGYENLDTLFDYGLDRIGRVVVTALGAAPDFDENHRRAPNSPLSPSAALLSTSTHAGGFPTRGEDDTDDRLTFHEFLVCNIECVHRMIPPDYYPPLTSKAEVHNLILETFFFHMFGKPYIAKQIPTSFDDLNMVETMAEVIGNAYDVLADVFLFCIAPTKYEEWTDQERHDRYIKILCGDACIEFEALMDAVKKFRMPLNLLAAEPTYELFCRYDTGIKKERAVIDFQGLTLICAHMSFTLYLTNAAYPTPQSKFQRLVEQYIVPQFQRRETIPPPQSMTRMITLESIKPERATVGTELWVFGTDFPIRATQNGHRCPLYVRFNDTVAKGACMSTTVGNVVIPRLPTTPDTITQVSLADGEEPGTFVVRLEAKTIAIVFISNDRLRWTVSQTVRMSFEDVLATYVVPNEVVETLRSLYNAFAEKGPDFELNGEVLQGPSYLSIVYYSKMCQALPLCVYDDGDTTQFSSRHVKFFESAKTRSDAIDITVPVVTFPEMVNTIFKQFIAQHGPDERLIDAVSEALAGAQAVIDKQLLEKRPKRSATAMGAARLAEYQTILSQVHAQTIREGNCVNCGQDPVVRAGENPFIDLEMIKRPALKKREETAPDTIFGQAISVFSEQLPRDPASEEITEGQFSRMTIEQADALSGRGKLYFLNNLLQRIIDTHEDDYLALETRFARSVEKSRTHGRYVSMQCLLLQQTLETISDGLSRIGAIVVEHENLVIQERKARLNGFVSESDTAYAMLTQLYQGLKATINTVRDISRVYVTDDDPDNFDVKFMFEEAATYKQHLMQQTLQLESAIKLRLDEIRCGPDITAEGLVSKKYLSDEVEDDDPEQAALRRQMSQAGADLLRRQSSLSRRGDGVSEDEVQNRLQAQQEMLEVAFDQKLKEAEKKKDQIIRESTLLLEGLLSHAQDYIEIPSSLGNPCFKFLHDRGSTLKRSMRELGGGSANDSQSFGTMSSTSPGGGGGGGGYRRPFVLTDDIAVQSDEDQFPTMLAMQKELLARGLTNGAKLGGPAVLLRKALTYAKEVLGKYSSNATIFSELSKIIKLELQNVMNPRTRDLITLPVSEEDMYKRDSVVNTELTFDDFGYTASYVKHQIHLEDLVTLVNVAKDEAAAAAAKANRRGVQGRRVEHKVKPSIDIPISPNTAALAARPDEMMALISLESVLPIETRVERCLMERNAKLVHALRAPLEGRCKETNTEPPPSKSNVHCEANFVVESLKSGEGVDVDDEDAANKPKKKGKKGKKESDSPLPSRGKAAGKPAPVSPQKTVSAKTVLNIDANDHQEADGNGSAAVVDDDVFAAVVNNAQAFSEDPSLVQKITKKAKQPTIDVPGPSMVRPEEKTIPQSQLNTGQTTEGLMQGKWDEVVESQQKQRGVSKVTSPTSTHADDVIPRRGGKQNDDPDSNNNTQEAAEESSGDEEDSDSIDDCDAMDRPVTIVYVEEDVIPQISLISAEVRASREAQTREIEASTAKLTAAIEKAMRDAPEATAMHIELQGMVNLVQQLRSKAMDLEIQLEQRNDQNSSLRDTIQELKRYTMQNLDGKHVVVRDVKASKSLSVDQQQVEAARQVLSDKAMVRSRIAKVIRKYKLAVSPSIQQKFEESVGSSASSGLLELEELMESILMQSNSTMSPSPHASAFGGDPTGIPSSDSLACCAASSTAASTGRTKPADFFQTVSEDCVKMLRVHFADDPQQLHGLTASAQALIANDPQAAMPVLARALLSSWDTSSVDQLVEATSHISPRGESQAVEQRVSPPVRRKSSFAEQHGNKHASRNAVSVSDDDHPAPLSRKPSHAAAASFFKTLIHPDGQGVISDGDIQSTSEAVRQMKVSTPTSKDRVLFMIAQHEAAQLETMDSLAGGTGQGLHSDFSHPSSPTSSDVFSSSNPCGPSATSKHSQHVANGMMSAVSMVPPIRVPPSLARSVVSPTSEGESGTPRQQSLRGDLGSFSKAHPLKSSFRTSPPPAGVPRLSLLFPNHHQGHRQQAADPTPFSSYDAADPRSVDSTPLHSNSNNSPPPMYRMVSSSSQTVVQSCAVEIQTDPPHSPAPSNNSDDSMYHIGDHRNDDVDDSEEDEEFDYAAYYPTAVPHSTNPVGADARSSTSAHISLHKPAVETTTVSAGVQTDCVDAIATSKFQRRAAVPTRLRTRDAAVQGDAGDRWVFIPSQSWHPQVRQLFDAFQASAQNPRTHEHTFHQWLLGVLHCLRSNMAPNLDFMIHQLQQLRQAAEAARDNIADLSYALLSSAIHAVQVLDESCGGPLAKFLEAHGDIDLLRGPVCRQLNSRSFEEANVLIANMMQHIDHRISGPRASHLAHSQRSLNRWRTHIVLTLLDTLEPDLQPCFPQHQRTLMSKLVEYEELSLQQQRQLFFLHSTALSLIIFSHCSRKSYVPLAHAAKVHDTPLPLSLQASSSSYLRMVRDCLLNKILPLAFNDIGLKPAAELSWMTKHFVSKILSFSREEFSWLHQLPQDQRSEQEQSRLDELFEIVEKSKKWNPVRHDLSSVEWLGIMRSAIIIVLGPGGRTVPQSMLELGPPPKTPVSVSTPLPAIIQASVVVDEPPAKQPSSLHEPPSFLRDVSWAKPALNRPSSFNRPAVAGDRQQQQPILPTKSDTPPPNSSWKKEAAVLRPGRAASLTPTLQAVSGGLGTGSATVQAFSASSNASVIATILQGSNINTVRPLSIAEQRELRDLRELCAGKQSTTSIPPPRSFRAWLDLEARQRVCDLRSTDLDATPSPVELQDTIARALRTVGMISVTNPSNIGSVLSQLSAAQTKMFVQALRGEELRGTRLPALD